MPLSTLARAKAPESDELVKTDAGVAVPLICNYLILGVPRRFHSMLQMGVWPGRDGESALRFQGRTFTLTPTHTLSTLSRSLNLRPFGTDISSKSTGKRWLP